VTGVPAAGPLSRDGRAGEAGTDDAAAPCGRGTPLLAEAATRIVDAVRIGREGGRSWASIVKALGVPTITLRRWLDEDGDEPLALKPVEIVTKASPQVGPPVLITASGVRVEGLDVASCVSATYIVTPPSHFA
jgi:hypothetical protein